MGVVLRHLSVCLLAGALGGIADVFVVWGAGRFGLNMLFGGAGVPEWSLAWVAWQVLAGALWGGLFLLPVIPRSVLFRGMLLGGAVALVRIFSLPAGGSVLVCGVRAGGSEPAAILLGSLAWGLAAACWVVLAQEPEKRRGLQSL